MSDKIINDLYKIKSYPDEIAARVLSIVQNNDSKFSEVTNKEHLFEIYSDRLEFSTYTGEFFEGLKEVVEKMKKSDLENIRLTYIDVQKRSCSVFSSEDYNIILGIIFYDN